MMTTIPLPTVNRQLRLRRGRYFRIVFRRKNDKVEGGRVVARAGELREMLCRLNVHAYKNRVTGLGRVISDEERAEEDRRCRVLTCWCVDEYHRLRRAGTARVTAGRRSYRRVNLVGVVEITPWIEEVE